MQNRVVWLIYDEYEAKRNKENVEIYFKEGKNLGIDIQLLIYEKTGIVIINNKNLIIYDGIVLKKPLFAIVRTICPLLSKHLELMGITVYNNSFISEICNNKMLTYQYIASLGIKVMNTRYINNENDLLPFPFIMKSLDGKGGDEVFKITSLNDFSSKKKLLEKKRFLMQEIAHDEGKDLRVFVIGKKIICSILRTSETDFRSNHSLGGRVQLYRLNDNEKNIIEKIISSFDFDFVGIDFVFSNGEIVFNEIEDVVGSRMVYELTDINITKEYLRYILEEKKYERFNEKRYS